MKKSSSYSRALLGVQIDGWSKSKVLEYISQRIKEHASYTHVVSLNPENMVVASEMPEFKECLNKAHVRLIDGVGVSVAARLAGFHAGDRFSGVDLMKELMERAGNWRLTVVLIGGKEELAKSIADRYSQAYPEAKFFGIHGIKNIKNPTKIEEKELKQQILAVRPHLVFVSFGSPAQELWIESHKELFCEATCIGVGGAFDFIGGTVSRAPAMVRAAGLEWLYRLWVEPWRWRRQLRLIQFMRLVMKEILWKKAS